MRTVWTISFFKFRWCIIQECRSNWLDRSLWTIPKSQQQACKSLNPSYSYQIQGFIKVVQVGLLISMDLFASQVVQSLQVSQNPRKDFNHTRQTKAWIDDLRGDHWTINHKSFFLTLIVCHTFLSYGHRAGGNLTVSKSAVLPNRHRRRLWHRTRGRLNWRSPNAAENETVTTGCKVVTWSCFFTDSIQYFLWILNCQKVYLNETLTPRRLVCHMQDHFRHYWIIPNGILNAKGEAEKLWIKQKTKETY